MNETLANERMAVAETLQDFAENLNQVEDHTELVKAWFRRRLYNRWNCKLAGHMHCYANLTGVHIPLTEEEMEIWVHALSNGEATLLVPPEGLVLPSVLGNADSDSISVISTTASHTIQYQRASRSLSLVDLRSAQQRLYKSISSSSSSETSSFSSASSGVAGIGHTSGKFVKWTGIKILNAVGSLEMRRRRWVIRRFLKRIQDISLDDRGVWLMKKKRKVDHAIEDLLELSSDSYTLDYRRNAITQGNLLQSLVNESFIIRDSDVMVFASSLLIQTFPLTLLASSDLDSHTLARTLRETLLQDSSCESNVSYLLAEITAQICFELAYGSATSWRIDALRAVRTLYSIPHARQYFQEMGENGALIKDMVLRVFQPSVDIREHALVLEFIVPYANDVPIFRNLLFCPNGIPLLTENVRDTTALENYFIAHLCCVTLSRIADFSWCVSAMFNHLAAACASLMNILVAAANDIGFEVDPYNQSLTAYHAIQFLEKFFSSSQDTKKEVVCGTLRDDLRRTFPVTIARMEGHIGHIAALRSQEGIDHLLAR